MVVQSRQYGSKIPIEKTKIRLDKPPEVCYTEGMKNATLVLLALLCVGCNRRKEDAPPLDTPHIAGVWAGTGTDDAVGYYNLQLTLTQSGTTASGNFTMASGLGTVRGTVALVDDRNILRVLTMTRTAVDNASSALADRVCLVDLTTRPNQYLMTGSVTSFSYTMSDCHGGTWGGGATLQKIAGTN